MGQELTIRDDGFAVAERGVAGVLIKGIILKFKDGIYTANKTEVIEQAPNGPFFVVVRIVTAWVHWENGKPISHKITQTGELHPYREDFGDLDQTEWPLGIGGVPSDPHKDTRYVHLVNLRSGKTYTFITDTIGGRQAVGELKDGNRDRAAGETWCAASGAARHGQHENPLRPAAETGFQDRSLSWRHASWRTAPAADRARCGRERERCAVR
jgi:hypothetical protein